MSDKDISISNDQMQLYLDAYIGKNSDKYSCVATSILEEETSEYYTTKAGWIWGAFLAPLSWAMYRKLWWLSAGLVGIVPLDMFVISKLIPDMPHIVTILPIYVAMQGKKIYIQQGLKKTKALIAKNTPEDEIIMVLRSTGGTSALAGIIGAIPTVLFVLLFALANFYQ